MTSSPRPALSIPEIPAISKISPETGRSESRVETAREKAASRGPRVNPPAMRIVTGSALGSYEYSSAMRFLQRLPKPEITDQPQQIIGMQTEDFRRSFIVTSRLAVGAQNALPLGLRHGRFKRAELLRRSRLAHGVRQIRRQDPPAFSQDYGVLHGVLQFPHIARPVVALDAAQRLGGELERGPAALLAEIAQKMVRQDGQILLAFPQWRST